MQYKTKVLIVDDHALIRRGLADLLRYEKDLSIVGEASDGESAIAAAIELGPDVVVMDLVMPIMDGVEATRRIKASSPGAKVLILTTFGTSTDVARAVKAGASGAIMKDASTEEQLAAIRAVAAGKVVIAPEIMKVINEEPSPEFTGRQRQILELISRGLTNKQIAAMLEISIDAVRQHLAAVFAKLDAANRSEAVAIAIKRQLIKL